MRQFTHSDLVAGGTQEGRVHSKVIPPVKVTLHFLPSLSGWWTCPGLAACSRGTTADTYPCTPRALLPPARRPAATSFHPSSGSWELAQSSPVLFTCTSASCSGPLHVLSAFCVSVSNSFHGWSPLPWVTPSFSAGRVLYLNDTASHACHLSIQHLFRGRFLEQLHPTDSLSPTPRIRPRECVATASSSHAQTPGTCLPLAMTLSQILSLSCLGRAQPLRALPADTPADTAVTFGISWLFTVIATCASFV